MKVFPLQATFLPPCQSLANDYREFTVKLGRLTAEDVTRTLDAIPIGVVPTSHSIPVFTDTVTAHPTAAWVWRRTS